MAFRLWSLKIVFPDYLESDETELTQLWLLCGGMVMLIGFFEKKFCNLILKMHASMRLDRSCSFMPTALLKVSLPALDQSIPKISEDLPLTKFGCQSDTQICIKLTLRVFNHSRCVF